MHAAITDAYSIDALSKTYYDLCAQARENLGEDFTDIEVQLEESPQGFSADRRPLIRKVAEARLRLQQAQDRQREDFARAERHITLAEAQGLVDVASQQMARQLDAATQRIAELEQGLRAGKSMVKQLSDANTQYEEKLTSLMKQLQAIELRELHSRHLFLGDLPLIHIVDHPNNGGFGPRGLQALGEPLLRNSDTLFDLKFQLTSGVPVDLFKASLQPHFPGLLAILRLRRNGQDYAVVYVGEHAADKNVVGCGPYEGGSHLATALQHATGNKTGGWVKVSLATDDIRAWQGNTQNGVTTQSKADNGYTMAGFNVSLPTPQEIEAMTTKAT